MDDPVTAPLSRRSLLAASGAALAFALAACSAKDPLAQQANAGDNKNYIAGDGSVTEYAAKDRKAPVKFSSKLFDGSTVDSGTVAGKVTVLNFWYAACPPCRAEASDLKTLSEKYADVPFLGVNISDTSDVAKTFETKYDLAYPSIIDAQTAAVQLAFSGAVSPNAVPTTLVMDREGRVAARISGLIRDPIILSGMIDRVVAEEG